MSFSDQEEKEVLSKITKYREEVLNACLSGKGTVADSWRLAVDEVKNFSRQNSPHEILIPEKLPLMKNVMGITQLLQESHRPIFGHPKKHSSYHWMYATDESKDAVAHYRYWIGRSKVNLFTSLEGNIEQAAAAALKYQETYPKVAFFAQEATRLFSFAQQQEGVTGDEILLHRWKTAAYEAAYLASIHLEIYKTAACNTPELAIYQEEMTSLREQSLRFRIKVAEATEQGEEIMALQYTLAAHAAGNAVDGKIKLIEFVLSENKEAFSYWKEVTESAEQVLTYRSEILKSGKNKIAEADWLLSIFYAENAVIYRMKALAAHTDGYSAAAKNWGEAAQATKQLAMLLAKKAVATILWNGWGLMRPYFTYFIQRAEHHAKKKVLKIFMSPVSFCLQPECLPSPERQALWEEDQMTSLITHYEVFHPDDCFYQTCVTLKKAGISCNFSFSSELPTQGVAIVLNSSFLQLFGRDKTTTAVFLVNLAVTSTPYLGMNLHLVQNKAFARLFPSALVMPPWPQPKYIPRNPARGNRFENVSFFGSANNLAPELRTQEWRQRLFQELGMTFNLKEESHWNDYSDVDCVLAIRDFSGSRHFDKQAAKLYTAWQAEVPFIGGTDAAYAAEGRPGQDYLVARSVEEVFKHLKRLKEDEAFRFKIVQNGLRSGENFTREAILQRWKILIEETLPNLAVEWQQASLRKKRWFLIVQRIAYFANRYLR